jgi:hypothetical protein
VNPDVSIWAQVPDAEAKWQKDLSPFFFEIKDDCALYKMAVDQFKDTFNKPNRQSGQNPPHSVPTIKSVKLFCNPSLDEQFHSKKKMMEQKACRRKGMSIQDLEHKVQELVHVRRLFHGTSKDVSTFLYVLCLCASIFSGLYVLCICVHPFFLD